MWATLVGKIIGGLPESVVNYYKRKKELEQELKLAKLTGKIKLANAKAERKASAQQHTQDWEKTYVALQRDSWKDELVLIVFLCPWCTGLHYDWVRVPG